MNNRKREGRKGEQWGGREMRDYREKDKSEKGKIADWEIIERDLSQEKSGLDRKEEDRITMIRDNEKRDKSDMKEEKERMG